MKRITKIILLLKNYPILFFRRLILEIRSLLPFPNQLVRKRIRGICFEFDFTCGPVIRDMFLGKYEMLEVAVMEKILKKGDTFIDVGANIGYLSAIGAGLVGKTGEVHSFEPVQEYFQRLRKMAMMNPDYKIITNQCALGEIESTAQINIAGLSNIGWNTMVTGFMKPETRKESIEVPVRRLDNYIKEHNLNNITLIKIDVEGFEFAVLKGLYNFFIRTPHRPSILCEVSPEVCSLMGYQLKDLFDYMEEFGYIAFDLNKKRLNWREIKELSEVLFIALGRRKI